MKKIFSILLIGTFFAACNPSTTTEKAAIDVAAVKTIQLHVTGMTCEGCENTVKDEVNKIEGVSMVEASHTAELATVSYDTTLTDMAAISAAIKGVGYEVVGLATSEPDEQATPADSVHGSM